MKRPPANVMIVGHPLIATPMLLASGAMLLAGLKDGILFIVLTALVLLVGVGGAYNQASAYRAWALEWSAMAPQEAPRVVRQPPAWLTILVLTGCIFAALWYHGEAPQVALRHVAELGIGIAAIAIPWAAIRRLGRRRRGRSSTVTIVARPVMAVPSLTDAYRALPPYCHALLQGRP